MEDFYNFTTGWIDSPDDVSAVAAELPNPVFGDTEASTLPESEIPDHVYLWDLARKVTGNLLPPRNQGKVGSCVGHGTARANEYTMLAEIAQGQAEEFKPIAPEVIYGGSRVEIGGGRLRGDGSIGAWAGKWVNQYGLVARGVYGKLDLRSYNEQTCRQLGANGIPADVESVAREHPVGGITLIKSLVDLRKALAQGFAVAICSGVGFQLGRDGRGVCSRKGVWNHCMTVAGFATLEGKKIYRIDNSWGDMAHTGPVGPGNPGPEGFYCEEDAMAEILAAGDSWAFSDVKGFVRKPVIVDWFI